MKDLIAKLLQLADAYSAATDINTRLLSDRLFSDRRRLDSLRVGEKDLNTRTLERAALWFSSNWPEGHDWPEGVDRPYPPEPDDAEPPQSEVAA